MLHFILLNISCGLFFSVRVIPVSSVDEMIHVIHIQGRSREKEGNSSRTKRVQNVKYYWSSKDSCSA